MKKKIYNAVGIKEAKIPRDGAATTRKFEEEEISSNGNNRLRHALAPNSLIVS